MAGKQELDKESMYRKIMPSAARAADGLSSSLPADGPAEQPFPPRGAETPEPSALQAAAPAPHPAPLPAAEIPAPPQRVPVNPPPPEVAEPPAPQAAPGAAAIPDIDAALFAGLVPEPTQPADVPRPVNLAELLVNRVYPRYQQRLNGCRCGRCRDDACGIALNKVKPRYVASDRMDPAALNERELVAETVTALMRALFIVKRRPHHTADDLLNIK